MTYPLTSRNYWIFDLDGTLTLPVHDFAFIRRELHVPHDSDILDHLDRLPVHEATLRRTRLDEIEYGLAAQAQASPGVADLLDQLAYRGARLGVLTRNSREMALVTLEAIGLGHYFEADHIIGRCQAPPKPDPGGILQLLDRWGATAGDAVMVGDYLFDLQAGRAAGALTVHVGRPDGQRWPEVSDVMVADLVQLTGLLDAAANERFPTRARP